MSTLENLSSRLMMPAKDLADWNFPLAQVLEEYYKLLDKPSEINYGEAALVVQNSTNVYSRRVEYLFDKTVRMGENLHNSQSNEGEKKDATKEKKSKSKSNFDFNDFESINLSKEIGKSINLKEQRTNRKSIKLLNRRFTQLETNNSHLISPVEILDIHGEIIGKKYDFRCNQQVTMTGMLVDELTPNDFPVVTDMLDNNALLNPTQSSGYCSDSHQDCEPRHSELSSESNRKTRSLNVSGSSFDDLLETTVVSNQHDSDYCSLTASSELSPGSLKNYTSIGNRTSSPDRLSNDYVEHDREDFSELTLTENVNSPTGSHDADTNIISNNPEDEERTITDCQCNDKADSNERQTSSQEVDTTENNSNRERTIRGCSSSERDDDTVKLPVELEQRRSKRLKNANAAANDDNTKVLEPIPFKCGVPEKLPKRRTQFKLPCHISLLKFKSESRKRKPISEAKRKQRLTRNILEYESERKKMTMYSPTKQMFTIYKKEELEEFQKTCDLCFKSIRDYDIYNYEPVSTITMDLLGFKSNFANNDPLVDQLPYTTQNTSGSANIISTQSRLSPQPSTFTPPDTPEPEETFIADCSMDFDPEIQDDVPNYQTLIERRMLQLLQESDVQTELEQRVLNWHKSLKPKLLEAERRATFHIHEYSERILENLCDASTKKLSFESTFHQESPTEVARYFLATLQLANSYNIAIEHDEDLHQDMELILLNSETSTSTAISVISKTNSKKRRHL
ncbi:uncharacterized protein LOC107268884 isoform X2 [Cephus cinctus]|nr:uncharacterized protein LOC107268884 isoform X2 [Cephus cinctus]